MTDELDSLNLFVTEAILRAETLTDLGSPNASAANLDVSLLEERIAERTTATTPEGVVARRGAVRAAIAAGEIDRAEGLIARFSADADVTDDLRADFAALMAGAASGDPGGGSATITDIQAYRLARHEAAQAIAIAALLPIDLDSLVMSP